jgi:hypothetical protein
MGSVLLQQNLLVLDAKIAVRKEVALVGHTDNLRKYFRFVQNRI